MPDPIVVKGDTVEPQVKLPTRDNEVLAHFATLTTDLKRAREEVENPALLALRTTKESDEYNAQIALAAEQRAKEDLKLRPAVTPPPPTPPSTNPLVALVPDQLLTKGISIIDWHVEVKDLPKYGETAAKWLEPVTNILPEVHIPSILPKPLGEVAEQKDNPDAWSNYAKFKLAVAEARYHDLLERVQNRNPFITDAGGQVRNFDASMRLLLTILPIVAMKSPELAKELEKPITALMNAVAKKPRSVFGEMGYDMTSGEDDRTLAEELGIYRGPVTPEDVLRDMKIPRMAREKLEVRLMGYVMYHHMRTTNDYLISSWGGVEARAGDPLSTPERREQARVHYWQHACDTMIAKAQQEAHARMFVNVAAGFANGADDQGRFTERQFAVLALMMELRRRDANERQARNDPDAVQDTLVQGYLYGSSRKYHTEITPLPNPDEIVRKNFPGRINLPLAELSRDDIQKLIEEQRSAHLTDVRRCERNIAIISGELPQWIRLCDAMLSFTKDMRDNPPAQVRSATTQLVVRDASGKWVPGSDFAAATAPLQNVRSSIIGLLQTDLKAMPYEMEGMLMEYEQHLRAFYAARHPGQNSEQMIAANLSSVQRFLDMVIPRPPDLGVDGYEDKMKAYNEALKNHAPVSGYPTGRNGSPTGFGRPLPDIRVTPQLGRDRGLKEQYDKIFPQFPNGL